MRILIVHNSYGAWSGEESALSNIERILKREGHEVRWFSKSSAGLSTSLKKKVRAFCSGVYSFKSQNEIHNYLQELLPDVVLVQNLYPWLSPSILKPIRLRGIPIVMRCPNYRLFCPNGLHLCAGNICERCFEAGREFWCLLKNCTQSWPKSAGYALRNFVARTTRMILDNVTVFVVLSDFQKQRFETAGIPGDQMDVLPNFTTVPPLDDNGRSFLGDKIVFAGRLSPEKGVTTFLDAARKLPHLAFVIAGNMTGMRILLRRAPSNVQFLGQVSRHALWEVYKHMRMLVVPSLCFEGFPNVLTEAMAMRKPVICSDIGGLPEIVDDGVTGLLFKPGNAEDLSFRIQSLWDRSDICRRMGRAGREKAIREYSSDKYYERLMTIFEKAIERCSPPSQSLSFSRSRLKV